jgi:hypothetical protein
MAHVAFRSDLPDQLAVLAELALDLRWTWSHAGDDLWRMINAEVWERTRNPWTLLQDVSRERLETLARRRDGSGVIETPDETVTGGQCRHRWDRVASFEHRTTAARGSFEANARPGGGTAVATLLHAVSRTRL